MIPVLGPNSDFTAAPSASLLERFRDSKQPAYSTFETEATQAVWAERNVQAQRPVERKSYSDGNQEQTNYSTQDTDRFRDQGRSFEEERLRTDARVRDDQRMRDQERARQDERVRNEQRSRNDDRSRNDGQNRVDERPRAEDRPRDDDRVRESDNQEVSQRADDGTRADEDTRVNERAADADKEVSETDEPAKNAKGEKVEEAGDGEGKDQQSAKEDGEKAKATDAANGDDVAAAENVQAVTQEPTGADFAMYAFELAQIREGTGKVGKGGATKAKIDGVAELTEKVAKTGQAAKAKVAVSDDANAALQKGKVKTDAATDENAAVEVEGERVVADEILSQNVEGGEGTEKAVVAHATNQKEELGTKKDAKKSAGTESILQKLGDDDASRAVSAGKSQAKTETVRQDANTANAMKRNDTSREVTDTNAQKVIQNDDAAQVKVAATERKDDADVLVKAEINGPKENGPVATKVSHRAGSAQRDILLRDLQHRTQNVSRADEQNNTKNARSLEDRVIAATQNLGVQNVKNVDAADLVRETGPVREVKSELTDEVDFDEKALDVVLAAKAAAKDLVENPKPEGNPEAWKPLVDLAAMLPELTRGRKGFEPIVEKAETQQETAQGPQQSVDANAQFVDPTEIQQAANTAVGQRRERTDLPTETVTSAVRTEVEAVSGPTRQVSGPALATSEFVARGPSGEGAQGAKATQLAAAQDAEPSALHELRLAALEDPSLRVEMTEQSARLVVSLGDEGKVALHLRVNDRVADVTVMGTARDLLTSEGPELATALAEQGLSLGNFQLGGQTQGEEQRESQAEMSDDDYEDMQVNSASASSTKATGARRTTHNGLSVKA